MKTTKLIPNLKSAYMLILGLILILSFFQKQGLNAQSIQMINGTQTSDNYIDTIQKYISEEQIFFPDSIDVHIGIVVYKIKNVVGEIDINDIIIQEAIDVTNKYFAPSGIQFYVLSYEILNDYNYAEVVSDSILDELTGLYSYKDAINLYIVNFALDSSYYGLTYYPDELEKNYIFLRKDFLVGNYLPTLMGNFFGLLPTHEITGGKELVNGTNCSLSGDFICDTYADPYLYGNVLPDYCIYRGLSKDDNDEFYVPSVVNIMSESPDNCKCIITELQNKRIQFYYYKLRNYLK